MNIAEAMANVLKSDKSTLGERAALSTVFKPGFMALNKWLGTPTKNVGDYLPAGHVGQNWIYHPTNKNLVQVTHGSTVSRGCTGFPEFHLFSMVCESVNICGHLRTSVNICEHV